jgi:hypothetical protein
MENEATASTPKEDSSKPATGVAKPIVVKPQAMVEELSTKLPKGVRLNVALADVVHIQVVGTDFVLTLSSGA